MLYTMIIVTALSCNPQPEVSRKFFSAIWTVETSQATDGPSWGDGGRSRGPLQISRAAWIDSGIPGSWSDCDRLAYAKLVLESYLDRYCIERRLGHMPTDQDRARIWNGGPNGYKKKSTLLYWSKVQRLLNQ